MENACESISEIECRLNEILSECSESSAEDLYERILKDMSDILINSLQAAVLLNMLTEKLGDKMNIPQFLSLHNEDLDGEEKLCI